MEISEDFKRPVQSMVETEQDRQALGLRETMIS
jgi:hypothetical protein